MNQALSLEKKSIAQKMIPIPQKKEVVHRRVYPG
jgi:hypothetical protein